VLRIYQPRRTTTDNGTPEKSCLRWLYNLSSRIDRSSGVAGHLGGRLFRTGEAGGRIAPLALVMCMRALAYRRPCPPRRFDSPSGRDFLSSAASPRFRETNPLLISRCGASADAPRPAHTRARSTPPVGRVSFRFVRDSVCWGDRTIEADPTQTARREIRHRQ
jgi:hypothetical protein